MAGAAQTSFFIAARRLLTSAPEPDGSSLVLCFFVISQTILSDRDTSSGVQGVTSVVPREYHVTVLVPGRVRATSRCGRGMGVRSGWRTSLG